MRRRDNEYDFIDPIVIRILNKSTTPLQPLAINFMVNRVTKEIIPFHAVKERLRILVNEGKVSEKVKNDGAKDISFYYTNFMLRNSKEM